MRPFKAVASFNFPRCHKCLPRSGIIRQKMAIKNSRHDYAIILPKPMRFISSSWSQNKAKFFHWEILLANITPPYPTYLVRELYIAVFKQYRTCSNYWETVTTLLLLLFSQLCILLMVQHSSLSRSLGTCSNKTAVEKDQSFFRIRS